MLTEHRSEIQSLFDVQISGILRKIDKQLDWMQTHRSRDDVVSYSEMENEILAKIYRNFLS